MKHVKTYETIVLKDYRKIVLKDYRKYNDFLKEKFNAYNVIAFREFSRSIQDYYNIGLIFQYKNKIDRKNFEILYNYFNDYDWIIGADQKKHVRFVVKKLTPEFFEQLDVEMSAKQYNL
jgi:hypothetical protein